MSDDQARTSYGLQGLICGLTGVAVYFGLSQITTTGLAEAGAFVIVMDMGMMLLNSKLLRSTRFWIVFFLTNLFNVALAFVFAPASGFELAVFSPIAITELALIIYILRRVVM